MAPTTSDTVATVRRQTGAAEGGVRSTPGLERAQRATAVSYLPCPLSGGVGSAPIELLDEPLLEPIGTNA
jgi:hypothetical protein